MTTITETPEQAIARIRAMRLRSALEAAPSIVMHIRSLIDQGTEHGEVDPHQWAPMRLSPTDDADSVYAQILNWVGYWSEQLDSLMPATAVVAWSNSKEVQGFRAGTTPEGAQMLIKLQTMWLLARASRINEHPAAETYQTDVMQLIWSMRSKYPTAPRPPKQVSPRPCPVCGESAVGAEWRSEEILDVAVRCAHCEHVIEGDLPQLVKWLDYSEPVVALSEACASGNHRECAGLHCECSCHEPAETPDVGGQS